jgi:hypothetical protein
MENFHRSLHLLSPPTQNVPESKSNTNGPMH